ncbi:hypothetical protein EL22_26155 [Halostagnicola sp. A56]|nr:hypothetical protein EL22_26155 [Halostagnicola sp. A56]
MPIFIMVSTNTAVWDSFRRSRRSFSALASCFCSCSPFRSRSSSPEPTQRRSNGKTTDPVPSLCGVKPQRFLRLCPH